MIDEDLLREELKRAADGAAVPRIDEESVRARVRRRRSPSAALLTAAAVVTVIGLGGAAFALLGQYGGFTGAASDSADSATSPQDVSTLHGHAESSIEEDLTLSGPSAIDLCGAPVAEATAASALGLAVELDFESSAAVSDAIVRGRVVIRNDGTERVVGRTAYHAATTLSENGVVVQHVDALRPAGIVVDLAPGESMTLDAAFPTVRCDPMATPPYAPGDELPPLDPGRYEISASLPFVPDAGLLPGTPEEHLVTGRQTITLD